MKNKPDSRLKRLTTGPLRSDDSLGMNGAFTVTGPKGKLQIIASDQGGWEHVSVCPVKQDRTPTWEEMAWVKELFWNDDECVVQYHPARQHYVNNHPYVLHLWKPIGQELPLPPTNMVGIPRLRVSRVLKVGNGYVVVGRDE